MGLGMLYVILSIEEQYVDLDIVTKHEHVTNANDYITQVPNRNNNLIPYLFFSLPCKHRLALEFCHKMRCTNCLISTEANLSCRIDELSR